MNTTALWKAFHDSGEYPCKDFAFYVAGYDHNKLEAWRVFYSDGTQPSKHSEEIRCESCGRAVDDYSIIRTKKI